MILLLIGLCLAGLRAISVLRIFDTFAYLIQMLRQSLSDMVPFLLLIYLIVLLFCLIYYVMKGDNLKHAWGSDTDLKKYFFFFGEVYSILFGENPPAEEQTIL